MNREQFMKQLSYLLQDISDEDRTDALDYYENYLDEAGFGYETDITNELGSPERIAAIIRTSLLSNPDETGEFTDSGYEIPALRIRAMSLQNSTVKPIPSPELTAANIRILPADPNQAKRMDRHSKAAVPFIREQSVPAPGPAAC